MAWTTPVDQTTGTLITSSIYNAHIIDNLKYLHGDAGTKVDVSGGGQQFRFTGIETVAATNANVLQNFFVSTDTQPAFKIFAQGAMVWGPGGSSAIDIELARTSAGILEFIVGNGFGYGTGTGGTVTQATSKSTAVTLNKPTGQITMNNASLAAGASVTFLLNNNLIDSSDLVVTNSRSLAGLGVYLVQPVHVVNAGGAVLIQVTNIGSTASEAVLINFAVVKGATS